MSKTFNVHIVVDQHGNLLSPGTQPPVYYEKPAADDWAEKVGGIVKDALIVASPVDAILNCPKCGLQHIDAPNPKECQECGFPYMDHTDYPYEIGGQQVCGEFKPWTNPPHKKHRCHGCNHVWKPVDFPTNGVEALKTS